MLRATSPDKIDVTIEDDYQDVEIDAQPTREELIARYHVTEKISHEYFILSEKPNY